MHHQGVALRGDGLVPVAWAPDGMVEAVEYPDKRFIVGLQWHPECLGAAHPAFRCSRACGGGRRRGG